jgi:putative sugar O-methyltransferase
MRVLARMNKVQRSIFFLREEGLLNTVLKVRNRLRLWTNSEIPGNEILNSSITDSQVTGNYPSFAYLASKNPEDFKRFRANENLIQALDHVSIKYGKMYIDSIKKSPNFQLEMLKTIRQLDSIGEPFKYYFKGFGLFSPTYLRYLSVYLNLTEMFGDLSGMVISEIGVGFGGQSSIILKQSQKVTYNFYDLPQVLNLTKKFLDTSGIKENIQFMDGRHPEKTESDLLISNYAFSELARELQLAYIRDVLLNSKSGYITWNNLSSKKLGGLSVGEIIRLIPNSDVLAEYPLTSQQNTLIYWKK